MACPNYLMTQGNLFRFLLLYSCIAIHMYISLVVYPDEAEAPPMTTPTRYTTTVYLDVDTDFRRYDPGHRLAEVDTFTVESAHGPQGAAEETFRVGQKGLDEAHRFLDASGQAYPLDVRSVSVADLIKVSCGRQSWFLAVAGVGFTEIVEPANPIADLAEAERVRS